ncbi:MAG: T9SS type A sorting domain-containing protein [Flavobacteriales bacterium]
MKLSISAGSLFFALSCACYAGGGKTVYSIVNNASTSNGSHWSLTSGGASCSCTPDFSKDIINIVNNSTSSSAVTVSNGAELYISNNSTFSVTGNLTFNNGSIVSVANGSTLSATGLIDNKNNSNQITVNGSLNGGSFSGGNGSELNGSGTLNTAGAASVSGSGKVFGSGSSCSVGPCSASAGSPLPVKLVEFRALSHPSFVELQWSTASEINNDYFSVEASNDGLSFLEKGRIAGAGNSSALQYYSFRDEAKALYYRLKQVDFNGAYSYSEVRHSFGTPDGNVNIEIYDLSGQLLYSAKDAVLNISELSEGLYIVKTTGENNSTQKIFVVR